MMTRDKIVQVVANIKYSHLHPADRRELNKFLEEKRVEIASKYFELCRRLDKVDHEESERIERTS